MRQIFSGLHLPLPALFSGIKVALFIALKGLYRLLTKPRSKKSIPRTKNIYGTKVKSLKSIKRSTQRLAKKESAKYRRKKDIDTLDRIKEVERINRMF